jgi:hypothetical protein
VFLPYNQQKYEQNNKLKKRNQIQFGEGLLAQMRKRAKTTSKYEVRKISE